MTAKLTWIERERQETETEQQEAQFESRGHTGREGTKITGSAERLKRRNKSRETISQRTMKNLEVSEFRAELSPP